MGRSLPIKASTDLIMALLHANIESNALSRRILLFLRKPLHAVAERKTLSRRKLLTCACTDAEQAEASYI